MSAITLNTCARLKTYYWVVCGRPRVYQQYSMLTIKAMACLG